MIGHVELGRLRLAQFASADAVRPLEGWEYLDERWVGEAIGFTEWLRLEDDPETLRSIALDLGALEPVVIERALDRIGLDVARGMTRDELEARFGPGKEERRFRPDRQTIELVVGTAERYRLGCTILDRGGLTYVTLAMLPLRSGLSRG